MTDNINKLFRDYLQGQGYNGKSVNDLTRRALRWEASSPRNNVNDLWNEYKKERGSSGELLNIIK